MRSMSDTAGRSGSQMWNTAGVCRCGAQRPSTDLCSSLVGSVEPLEIVGCIRHYRLATGAHAAVTDA